MTLLQGHDSLFPIRRLAYLRANSLELAGHYLRIDVLHFDFVNIFNGFLDFNFIDASLNTKKIFIIRYLHGPFFRPQQSFQNRVRIFHRATPFPDFSLLMSPE